MCNAAAATALNCNAPRGALLFRCNGWALLLNAVYCSLERGTRLERGSLGGFDLQLCSGGRVAPGARGALAHFEGAEANQGDAVAFFQRGRDVQSARLGIGLNYIFSATC